MVLWEFHLGVSFGGGFGISKIVETALSNQSVLHCWIHKLVVFKVIGTNCILLVQFLCRVFPPGVNYPLLGSEKFKQFHLNSEYLTSVTPQNIYSTCTRIESVIPFFLS